MRSLVILLVMGSLFFASCEKESVTITEELPKDQSTTNQINEMSRNNETKKAAML